MLTIDARSPALVSELALSFLREVMSSARGVGGIEGTAGGVFGVALRLILPEPPRPVER